MFASRLGSLNALEQVKGSPFLKEWLNGPLPSADSIGRISNLIEPKTVREALRVLYAQLKRNKAIAAPWHGLMCLVIDGHESHSSYARCCQGCLERQVQIATGKRTQYYHRYVTGMLLGKDFEILLDSEPQCAGEDEVAAAIRLLDRLLRVFPRAFDVVLADALYSDPRFFGFLVSRGKEAMTVLKENQPGLLSEARTLSELTAATEILAGKKRIECWDMDGFAPWPECGELRVVRTRERSIATRSLDKTSQERVSEWFWLTTLDRAVASPRATVEMGHSRWVIENRGFNELTNEWGADHVYKHQPTAILVFTLLCILAFNLFQAFWARNLKPARKAKVTKRHVAQAMLEEVFRGLYRQLPQPP
jgi:Transposase DDE domain.